MQSLSNGVCLPHTRIELGAKPRVGSGTRSASYRSLEELTQLRRLRAELFHREVVVKEFPVGRLDGIHWPLRTGLDGDGAVVLFQVTNDGKIGSGLDDLARGRPLR